MCEHGAQKEDDIELMKGGDITLTGVITSAPGISPHSYRDRECCNISPKLVRTLWDKTAQPIPMCYITLFSGLHVSEYSNQALRY